MPRCWLRWAYREQRQRCPLPPPWGGNGLPSGQLPPNPAAEDLGAPAATGGRRRVPHPVSDVMRRTVRWGGGPLVSWVDSESAEEILVIGRYRGDERLARTELAARVVAEQQA